VKAFDFWQMSYRPGGWVRLDSGDRAPSGFRGKVFLQLRKDERGRMLIHQAVMAAEVPISARTWRQVPFAEVEAYASNVDARQVLEMPSEIETAIVADLDRYFDETAGNGLDLDGLPEPPEPRSTDGPLEPPAGRLEPAFLQRVAVAYGRAMAEKRAPAPAIAEVVGVPVPTVRGWIARAREAGYLAPGRRGRVG
jgi:hypothetical protein